MTTQSQDLEESMYTTLALSLSVLTNDTTTANAPLIRDSADLLVQLEWQNHELLLVVPSPGTLV